MRGRDSLSIALSSRWPIALVALLNASVWAQDVPAGAPSAAASASTGGQKGWQIRSALSVGEHYSDNISLSAPGSERSELTTRIGPSVSVSGNSARLRLEATYSPELLYRANQATTDISHYLNMLGNAELWSRTLFLDVRAGITQQNVSSLGPQSDSNLNTTGNRTSIKTYSVSPYLRHDFGFNAFGELRYTHDSVHQSGNSSATSNSTSNRIDAKIASGPAFKLFTWSAIASVSKVDYSRTGQEVDARSYTLSGGRLVTPDLRLNANVGYEDSGYPSTTGQELKGKFWSVGPEWTPTERTRIAATYGRRYFGPSRTFSISHRARQAFVGVDYNESVTTTRSNFTAAFTLVDPALINAFCQAQFSDPLLRAQCVANITQQLTVPLDFLTDSLFLEKRLQGQIGIQGVKNTVIASFFSSNRQAITTTGTVGGSVGDFGSSENIKQTGGGISWASRLTQTFASNASFSVSRNSFADLNRTDRLTSFRVGVTKEFDPKTSGSLSLARVKNDSSAASTSYDENSISATLGMRF